MNEEKPKEMPLDYINENDAPGAIGSTYFCWQCGKKFLLRHSGTIILFFSYHPSGHSLKCADVRMVGVSDNCVQLYKREFTGDEASYWSRRTPHFCGQFCFTYWALEIATAARREMEKPTYGPRYLDIKRDEL